MTKEHNYSFPTTLIIGLGGVGGIVTSEIYQKFLEGNPSDVEKRNLVCLCLDTDAGDQKGLKEVMPKTWVVQTSSNQASTVRDYINRIKGETHVLDWFDTRSEEVMKMMLNKGAGQVRMASRLALMSAIYENKLSAINSSIDNLLVREPERHQGNNINVHIICSLAGGSGAGSFLQVAYYVREALRAKGVGASEIIGYFVLGDVLCEDKAVGFDNTQKQNTRSNTYACLKELNAFVHKKDIQIIKPLELEYKIGQGNISLPSDDPYDLCYMIDYYGVDGSNLGSKEYYYNQVGDFVFLNALSPTGDNNRSRAINNIRERIRTNGSARYSAIGVSKLVYPVEDLFEYFATQRLVDNLKSTWLRIDRDYKQLKSEYNRKLQEGIPAVEPKRGRHFMDQVKSIARNGTGWERTEFNAIYNSTQILDEELMPMQSKAETYMEHVYGYLGTIVSSSKLVELEEECDFDFNYQINDPTDDVNVVERIEKALNDFKKYVAIFIDNNKSVAIKECFLKDADEELRVSKDAKHHLNTYMIEKDHELHPIAVRYVLYDVLELIEGRLSALEVDNKTLWDEIEGYKFAYDLPETEDYVETAKDSIDLAYEKDNGLKKVWNKITSQHPVSDCKKSYRKKATIQKESIKTYAQNKLEELVLEGLKTQIGKLLEESENFFERLPKTLDGLQKNSDALLRMHDGIADPTISFVLAESKYKKAIYVGEISRSDTPFFPEDMSRQFYISMFDATKDALERRDDVAEALAQSVSVDVASKEKAKVDNDKKMFEKVLDTQLESMINSNRPYYDMNVLAALKKQARLEHEVVRDLDEWEYVLGKFKEFRDKAKILGATGVEQRNFINAWGVHPSCLDSETVSEEEISNLFGGGDVDVNPETAAAILRNDFYSKYEIIRTNSVNLLTLEENFKGLSSNLNPTGIYYKAYQDVVKNVNDVNTTTYSPHLDKNWHLPAYMPNIGSSMNDEMKDIYSALYFGVLFSRFKMKAEGGDEYWYVLGGTSDYVRDQENHTISIKGMSLSNGLNQLFEKALVNHPQLVNEVKKDVDKEWETARLQWKNEEYSESDALGKMKAQAIVKKMLEFSFHSINTNWNADLKWFDLLSCFKGDMILAKNMKILKNAMFEDILQRLIKVFGPSLNTKELCKYVFDSIKDVTLKDEANEVIGKFDTEHKFELN